jgi:cytochrome c553
VNKIQTLFILTFLCSSAAMSQTAPWNEIKGDELIALQAKGDASRGEAAFVPCQGCHRRDGSGRTSGAYPRLSGQHATVLIKQIVDIRGGRRINPKMEPFLDDHAMTPYEIADIAAYLQGLPMNAEIGKGPGNRLAAGKAIYEKDCVVCHGAAGQGDGPKFYPMLAAQHYRYLLREMQFIRDAARANSNPDMVKVIKPYSDAELENVADYLSRLPPPPPPTMTTK